MGYGRMLERAETRTTGPSEGIEHTGDVSEQDVQRIAEASVHPERIISPDVDLENADGTMEDENSGSKEEMATQELEPSTREGQNSSPSSATKPDSDGAKYRKDVMDEVSESLSVIAYDEDCRRFFSDVMSEFGARNPRLDTIKGQMTENGYTEEEVSEKIEQLKTNHIIKDGKLSSRAKHVAEFAAEVHDYISDLKSQALEAKSKLEEHEMIDQADVDLNQNYFGRSSDSVFENSDMENVAEFISPFDRSVKHRSGQSNPLMAFMMASESGDRHGLGGDTGYSSDSSAAERLRQIGDEGYLDIKPEGQVELTEAGRTIKQAAESLYEQFESVMEEEQQREKRLGTMQNRMQQRQQKKKAAEELDKLTRQMKSAENIDWEESKRLLEESYGPITRKMSNEYEEGFALTEYERVDQ